VRDGHIRGHSAEALALYLFLVTVCDADGLSWYSDTALCRVFSWAVAVLRAARDELRDAGLVAYRRPLYQVLDLAPVPLVSEDGTVRRSGTEPVAIGEILTGLLQGGAQ